MKIKNINIGISTYGTITRAGELIRSIRTYTDQPFSPNIILCDDGTGNQRVVNEMINFCKNEGVEFIHNETNLGIPSVWNKFLNFHKKADLLIIFSDGVRIITSGWLKRIVYFFENNDNVGTVGLPHVDTLDFNNNLDRWQGNVGRCGAAVGCAFGVNPKTMLKVENPDGVNGYWEDLVSFHEEIHAGFRLNQLGYYSYMLPYSPVHYRGGVAFSLYPELTWRQPSSYLPIDVFIKWIRKHKWYVSSFEEKYSTGNVDRMSYSRIMFAKYWGLLDRLEQGDNISLLDNPPAIVHPQIIDESPQTISFLDYKENEQKITI